MQQQGRSRKKQAEARRRFFQSQLTRPGQPPAGPPPPGTTHAPGAQGQPQPQPQVMESRPGHQGSIPLGQIQHHQVTRTSGLPGSQPAAQDSAFAPQSGREVPVQATGPRLATAMPPVASGTGVLPTTPRVDVTVCLFSSGSSAQLLGQQLQAIRRQSVQPAAIHIHADGPTGHDEQSLMKLTASRTAAPLGRHFRLALARTAQTKYVLLLEEDAMPGAQWLARAVAAMEEADSAELPFGPAVVACAGVLQGSESPDDTHPVGPELPRGEESLEVDYGRGGWLFATEFIRVVEGLPRVGASSDSLGILIAFAAQQAGIPMVVMGYGAHNENWGTVNPKQYGVDPQDAAQAFEAYLGMGWEPPYQGSDLPKASPQPAPVPAPAQLPAPAQPGQPKETRLGSTVMIERVLAPHEQTPDPSPGRERVLAGGEQTPPPVSSQTEQIVTPAPPPENAKTERIVASSPPKSQTGQ